MTDEKILFIRQALLSNDAKTGEQEDQRLLSNDAKANEQEEWKALAASLIAQAQAEGASTTPQAIIRWGNQRARDKNLCPQE